MSPTTPLFPTWSWRARSIVAGLALGAFAIGVVACSPAPERVPFSGEHDGLTVRGDLIVTGSSIVVETRLVNDRDEVVHIATDQCGRVVDVELERTKFRPEGREWAGSIQAVKERVLNDQRFDDHPDGFAPRRPGDASSATPECRRPELPIALEPGASIDERWELPQRDSRTLREVGSEFALVSIEAVEARDPTEMEYSDIVYWLDEDAVREGRTARAELPLAGLLDRPASEPVEGPSRGELFDRVLEHDELRAWIEQQPEDGWGHATLRPAIEGYGADFERLRLELVTTAYERSAIVTAAPDGSDVTVDLPGEDRRTRVFERTEGTVPPGIRAITDADYTLTDDLHLESVNLPSGRVVVGEYLFDAEPLDFAVEPGAYPVHATLARYRQEEYDSVAFVSLVLSDAPTVRWEEVQGIAVDGGSTTITSVEGRDELNRFGEADPEASLRLGEEIYNSIVAHDYLGTEWDLTPELNLVQVTSGVGDGGYPVFVGFDDAGRPTRVVVDFYLLHLSWPGS